MDLMDAAYGLVHRYPGGAASLGPRIDQSAGHMIAAIHALREALARRNQAGKPDIKLVREV